MAVFDYHVWPAGREFDVLVEKPNFKSEFLFKKL